MSSVRKLGSIVLLAVLVASTGACSKSEGGDADQSDRKVVSFAEPSDEATKLGLCSIYKVEQMKGIVGGGKAFRRLAPEAIGQEGDAVTGEGCSWERTEANGDSLNLRIEVRDFGKDTAGATARFQALEQDATDVTAVPGLGSAAFTSVTDDSSVLQAVQGGYLLTVASRSTGGLEPLSTDTLTLLGTAGMEHLT